MGSVEISKGQEMTDWNQYNPKQENNVQALSLCAASSQKGVYIYRNHVGTMYSRAGQAIKVGVIGSADSLGCVSVVIDESWLGRKVPIFFAAEFKRPKGGRQSPEQKSWENKMHEYGVPYRLITSPSEMVKFIEDIKSGEAG